MYNYFIAIDIGGTNVKCSRYYLNKKMSDVEEHLFIHSENEYEELRLNVENNIDQIIKSEKKGMLCGIAVIMGANFDRNTGIITKWPLHVSWRGMALKDILCKKYGTTVILEDDANAAALAEKRYSFNDHVENMVYITVGTGIGCSLILNGELFYGTNGMAGELGHLSLPGKKEHECLCGKKNCLQTYCGGAALQKQFDFQSGNYHGLHIQERGVQSEEIYMKAGELLGIEIANIIMLLDIDLIVLGGKVVEYSKVYFGAMKKSIYDNIKDSRKVNVVLSKINEKNTLLGGLIILKQQYDRG